MNKYQEALDEIMFGMALDTQNGSENVFIDLQEKFPDEFALLQELVDKATPKKPIDNRCPSCQSFDIRSEELNSQLWICLHCGQQIDWEGIEEDE